MPLNVLLARATAGWETLLADTVLLLSGIPVVTVHMCFMFCGPATTSVG